ncbi:MAG: hypothetical protein M3017_04135 [Actinomycetota bacterium]|nr:hypothetical protein [Actinomycetota bacterium]
MIPPAPSTAARGQEAPDETLLSPGRSFSRTELRAMSLDGVLAPVFADAYTQASLPHTPALRARAVALALPANLADRAVIGRLSAAWIYGCSAAPARISLLIDVGHRVAALRPWSGCILHEVSLGRFDAVSLAGTPVTTPLRTAVDLALHLDAESCLPALRAISRDASLGCPLGLIRQALKAGHRIPHKGAALERIRALMEEAG